MFIGVLTRQINERLLLRSDGGASTGPAYPYLYGSDGRRLRRSCASAAEVSSRARQVRGTADQYLTFYQYIVRFYEGPAARVIVYAPTALYIGPRPRMQSKEFTRDLFVSRASLFKWFLFGSMWHSQLRHVSTYASLRFFTSLTALRAGIAFMLSLQIDFVSCYC